MNISLSSYIVILIIAGILGRFSGTPLFTQTLLVLFALSAISFVRAALRPRPKKKAKAHKPNTEPTLQPSVRDKTRTEVAQYFGIAIDADEAIIKTAARRKMMSLHPDHGGAGADMDLVVKARDWMIKNRPTTMKNPETNR